MRHLGAAPRAVVAVMPLAVPLPAEVAVAGPRPPAVGLEAAAPPTEEEAEEEAARQVGAARQVAWCQPAAAGWAAGRAGLRSQTDRKS